MSVNKFLTHLYKVSNKNLYNILTKLHYFQASAFNVPMIPLIETDGNYSYQMLEALSKGNFKKIPMMLGFTSEEMIYYGKHTSSIMKTFFIQMKY